MTSQAECSSCSSKFLVNFCLWFVIRFYCFDMKIFCIKSFFFNFNTLKNDLHFFTMYTSFTRKVICYTFSVLLFIICRYKYMLCCFFIPIVTSGCTSKHYYVFLGAKSNYDAYFCTLTQLQTSVVVNVWHLFSHVVSV